MTSSAMIKQSDLKRLATVAKQQGVTVTVEINGRTITISPGATEKPKPVAYLGDIKL